MSSLLKALFVGATLALAGISTQAVAMDEVVLTVSGKVANGEPVDFTLAELEALGTASITTSSPWESNAMTFDGVPLAVLMEAVGASGDTASIVALNKYRTTVPVTDFIDHGVILASRKEGAPMPVSDKGPLFVVYPFDDKPELNSEIYHSRSAWQVRSIVVE
ncbi:molybdopterin-dependent oxidoreductase [Hoeflea ulvae]|uniref:Molybdopterin-dependent oxidoreductase n=1 Tax=Hoeflea ulvae TaxID=2983764 RepID=A0ABT3YF09_9HYPH|nr:molybdopterin-dependent oxidoreductase [Hoeflea ulvae]MCY0094481.1 molybdopterin-dependent oxidoreductase [Hoeflea ulvae]